MLALAAAAIPSRRDVTPLATDSLGNQITLTRVGDEAFHFWRSSDGKAYRVLSDGMAEEIRPAEMTALRKRSLARRKSTAEAHNKSQVPHLGEIRVPVLLVDYRDVPFRDGDGARQTFENFFQNGEKSARQYFIDQSNGRFAPIFDVYGPLHLSKNRASYGANGRDGNDIGMGNMVGEACQGLDGEIDFNRYDNDGDGRCDVVIVLYAGVGEASSSPRIDDAIWPAQWSLRYSEFGRSLRLDGVTVDDFAVFNELNGTLQSNIDGIGTFCHEFSHCLGLPDFYDTTEFGTNWGMGPWSLMDYGSYNDNTYTPIGYSAYEKWFMGWIDDIPEPKPGATVSLPAFNQKDAATDVACRLVNPADKNEYFVLESRARQGWDAFIEAEGLMIYHVHYDPAAWDDNSVNNYSPERMAIVAADDRRNDLSIPGDLFPYGVNNSFTDNSAPSSRLNNGEPLRKPVTEISRDPSTGTITFRFMADALPELNPPSFTEENRPAEADMAPSPDGFTAVWPAADTDRDVTYTLEVRPHSDYAVELLTSLEAAADFGWDTDPAGFAAYDDVAQAMHIGSGKKTGAVISPVIDFDGSNDALSVLLRAKAYGSDYGVSARVCLLTPSGSQLASRSVDISSGYKNFALLFQGIKPGSYRVRVETLAAGKRLHLKWARVYSGDASDLLTDDSAKAPASRSDNPATETLIFSGITSTSYRVEGLTPGGVYDWRVRSVPVDEAEALPSTWSERVTVELPLASGLTAPAAADGDDTPAEYFDPLGRRVATPTAPGLYIRRRGTATDKLLIR